MTPTDPTSPSRSQHAMVGAEPQANGMRRQGLCQTPHQEVDRGERQRSALTTTGDGTGPRGRTTSRPTRSLSRHRCSTGSKRSTIQHDARARSATIPGRVRTTSHRHNNRRLNLIQPGHTAGDVSTGSAIGSPSTHQAALSSTHNGGRPHPRPRHPHPHHQPRPPLPRHRNTTKQTRNPKKTNSPNPDGGSDCPQ
jgi:hypothetical protein